MKYKQVCHVVVKRKQIFKILSIVLIIIFIFLIPVIIQKLIKINKIECSLEFQKCPYIINGNYRDTKKQIEQQFKNDIQINSYLIQYKIPSTIKIDLVLKKPKYAIKDKNNNLYLIDKDGLVIDSINKSDLPILINSNAIYKVGDIISNKDKFALVIIEKVAWIYSIHEGTVEKNELKIILEKGILVRFPLEGDPDVLVGSLRLIFSRLNDRINGIRIEDTREIDLRFKNPILRSY